MQILVSIGKKGCKTPNHFIRVMADEGPPIKSRKVDNNYCEVMCEENKTTIANIRIFLNWKPLNFWGYYAILISTCCSTPLWLDEPSL